GARVRDRCGYRSEDDVHVSGCDAQDLVELLGAGFAHAYLDDFDVARSGARLRPPASVTGSGKSDFARTTGGDAVRGPMTAGGSSGNRASVVQHPHRGSGVSAVQ